MRKSDIIKILEENQSHKEIWVGVMNYDYDKVVDKILKLANSSNDIHNVSKCFYVRVKETKKIISMDFESNEDAESFIDTMNNGYNYKDVKLEVISVC